MRQGQTCEFIAPLAGALNKRSILRAGFVLALAGIALVAMFAAPGLPALGGMMLAFLAGWTSWAAAGASQRDGIEALRESEAKFRTLVEQSLVGLYAVREGVVVYANPTMAEMLGYASQHDLVGRPVDSFTAPEDLQLLKENHRRRLCGEIRSLRYTYRALKADGSRLWLEVHGSGCEIEGRKAVMGVALDVSKRVEFDHYSRLANRVFESASEGIVITDAEFRIQAVNPAFSRITGYPAECAVGKLSRLMLGQGGYDEVNRIMLEHLARDGHWQGEIMDHHQGGKWYPAWLSISVVRDASKHITNYVSVFTDNTSRKEAESKLHYLATHDSLTGLVNRAGLIAKIAQRIERARAGDTRFGLLFIDLDRFKSVNDTLGHAIGDRLLAAAAQRLASKLKHTDLLARLGGDEFTALVSSVECCEEAGRIAERLQECMALPFVIDGQELFATASIGIACYPDHGGDAASLLKNADRALYRSKERGGNTHQFFAYDMMFQASRSLLLENDLRHALERGEFELHYQPQVDAASGEIAGAEALIRWNHPELGMVAPGAFITLTEQTGMIVPIGAWVLRQACRQGRAWLDAGLTFRRIAVNLSARQLSSDGLLETIRDALRASGLPPQMLELEITESAIMRNPAEAALLLAQMRAMGVTLSVDDFGTGYSSLASLKQFPLDNLKIDRSFVRGIPTEADDVAITEAIIAIAHKMRLKVIAEGVESRRQYEFLRAAGCDLIQGFLAGAPMPAAAFERLCTGRRKTEPQQEWRL